MMKEKSFFFCRRSAGTKKNKSKMNKSKKREEWKAARSRALKREQKSEGYAQHSSSCSAPPAPLVLLCDGRVLEETIGDMYPALEGVLLGIWLVGYMGTAESNKQSVLLLPPLRIESIRLTCARVYSVSSPTLRKR